MCVNYSLLHSLNRMTADTDNPLVLEVVTASSTAYSYYPDVKISEVCESVLFVALSCPVKRGLDVNKPCHCLTSQHLY